MACATNSLLFVDADLDPPGGGAGARLQAPVNPSNAAALPPQIISLWGALKPA